MQRSHLDVAIVRVHLLASNVHEVITVEALPLETVVMLEGRSSPTMTSSLWLEVPY